MGEPSSAIHRPAGALLCLGALAWSARLLLPQPARAWVGLFSCALLPLGILGVHALQARRTGVPGAIGAIALAGVYIGRFGAILVDHLIAASGVDPGPSGTFERLALHAVALALALTGYAIVARSLWQSRRLPRVLGPALGAAGFVEILARLPFAPAAAPPVADVLLSLVLLGLGAAALAAR